MMRRWCVEAEVEGAGASEARSGDAASLGCQSRGRGRWVA
jgi:hypothetical protein